MEQLYQRSAFSAAEVAGYPQRNILPNLRPHARLNIIMGLRGVGKTTYLLHELNKRLSEGKKALYITLDDFYFLNNDLIKTISDFKANGGEYLFIDEVHYYENWDRAIKNIFDQYKDLKIMITASSAAKLYKSKGDLSRRAVFYNMPGLSFREYLYYHIGLKDLTQAFSLEEIILNRQNLTNELGSIPAIRKLFHDYLEIGYFPFQLSSENDVRLQIKQLIESTTEVDMRVIDGYSTDDARSTLAFLKHLAASAPYDLNVRKTASTIGFDRNKLVLYLTYLERAELVKLINFPSSKKGSLSKPDKIYLSNSNLYFSLNPSDYNIGSMRESFAVNQLCYYTDDVALHPTADFLVNGKYALEIGGVSKNTKQVANEKEGYLFLDNLEISYQNRIPLWLLGFLY